MASATPTPSERIRELGEINETISKALEDAGLAVQALSNTSPRDQDGHMESDTAGIAANKAQFEKHVKAYYTGVQAAIARLRRQAYALEEAGVISAEAPSFGANAQQRQQGNGSASDRNSAQDAASQDNGKITNGGLGNLDVGWLNSRGNQVSAEKEAELVKEAKVLLEGLTAQKETTMDET